MDRLDTPRKIKANKKEIMSKLMGNTRRTIDNHISEGKLYIDFFDQFTIGELEEFIQNGHIERLKLARDIPIDLLREMANVPKYQFDEHILKGALFKIEFGMDSNFILPIFIQSIKEIPTAEGGQIREQINKKVFSFKSGIFTHKNHKKIVADFIKKFLTDRELELLHSYYHKEK